MSQARVPRALVRELRAKLRDYPEINYLEKDEESRDHQLARCLWEALEDFNVLAPILDHWTFVNLPQGAVRVILNMALPIVLTEVTIWMMRNEFQYQSGNTSVRLYDKYRAYLSLIPVLKANSEKQATNMKVKLNIDGAWGSNITEMYSVQWLDDPRLYIDVQVS